MKKLAAMMLCLTFLCGCGAQSAAPKTTGAEGGATTAAKEISADAVAQALLNGLTWRDKLELLDADMRSAVLSAEETDLSQNAIYISSGATAEEIAVLVCPTEEAAERVLESVKTRVAEQLEAFRNYVPAEVPVLENAVTERHGNTVVMVVCDDVQAAQDVLKTALS